MKPPTRAEFIESTRCPECRTTMLEQHRPDCPRRECWTLEIHHDRKPATAISEPQGQPRVG